MLGVTFFLDWSFEHQFNLSSRMLNETIGKGVETLWGAVITDKTTELEICIPIWPTFA